MTDKLEIVMVPRELFYHEVAYVRGLEADNARLRAALTHISTFCIGKGQRLAQAALDTKP